jgi:PAS domain S-box-containing protein
MTDDTAVSPAAAEHLRSLETLEDFFENGVVGLHLVAGDGTILRANQAELDLLGYAPEEYVGQPIAHFHADAGAIADILSRLSRGERLDRYPAQLRHKDGSIRHVRISSSVLFREGTFINTRCFTVDVTDQVEAEAELKVEQARLALATQAARVGVWEWNIATGKMLYSPEAKAICGFGPDEAVTLDLVSTITHPEDFERTWPMAQRALDPTLREKVPYEYRIVRRDGEVRWVLAHGEAVFDGEGAGAQAMRYVGAIQDITERVEAARTLETSQARLRLAMDAAQMAVWDTETGSPVDLPASLAGRLGLPPGIAATLEDLRTRYLPGEQGRVQAAAEAAIEAGEQTFEAEYQYRRPDETTGWLLVRAEFEPRPDSEPPKATGVLIEISERKEAEAALRQSEERLRALTDELREESRALAILNKAGAAVAAELDLERLVQTVIDAGVELTGAAFGAFFYNLLDEQGARYTLYSLSGAPREAFDRFPMPRATAIFAPTFNGEGAVVSDDILADPRYGQSGPYHGMPKGHLPVRSYLAVPVRSRSGDVLGGLFFGHPEPSRFDARAPDVVTGLAGQAAIAIDNARLFGSAEQELAQRRSAEQELQTLNANLEQRIAREVAERSRAEEALRQAQKMEAVGQLTGGVAHDFNNLLTVIIGGLDTIRRSKPGDDIRIQRAADMALQGAERAASLTTRLLAFSRRQPLKPTPANLNLLMRSMTELLHRTLGETVELEGVLSPRLWSVEVDANQLESAILNLALNARDAMPEGGKLTIETANASLDESYRATDAEVRPGQYVMVSVSDSGAGMTADTAARVFEPFFTTKEVGKGTGLGLSMVYGFVKQSGGHVTIYSEPGHGTTVKLYFPRFMGEPGQAGEAVHPQAPTGHGEEVILVVEDNEDVRAYSVMVLSELGYSVVEAADADAGLEIIQGDQRIDLLFTDVVLPGKSGRQLAEAAQVVRPGLRVLFTTGYSRNAIVHHGRLDPGVHLLSKPFTFEQLAARVRDVLDDRA